MITGVDELQRNFAELSKKYTAEVAKSLVASGQLVRTDAIKSIQTISSGEQVTRYRLGGGKKTHTVSIPNDPPNTDTGRLVSSVQVEVRADDVYVGTNVEYAPWLEFGTQKMAARPWLFPALERNREAIKGLIAKAMRKVTNER